MENEFELVYPKFEAVKLKLIKNNKSKKIIKFDKSALFSDCKIANCVIKNRFVFINLTDCELYINGYPNLKHFNFYDNIAKSNVGLIFTGGLYLKSNINKNSISVPIRIDDESVKKHLEFNEQIHVYGTKVFMQINPILGRGDPLNRFLNILNYSASFNKSFKNSNITCSRVSDSFCNKISEDIFALVKFSKEAGYDGVLINGDELNILGEFSSSEFNRRIFGYFSKRHELVLKVLSNIKKLKYKTNIIYSLTIDNFIKEFFGNDLKNINSIRKLGHKTDFKDMCNFLVMLIQNGVDGFIFRFGTYETECFFNYNQFEENDLFYEFYSSIKDYLKRLNIKNKFGGDVSIIYTDNFDNLSVPSNYIKNNIIDLVDVTRQIYTDGEYLKKLYSDKSFKQCLKCGCCNKMAKENKIRCALNPSILSFNNIRADLLDKKVAVIGAGISGLTVSIYLTNRGAKVDVYEKNNTMNKTGRLYEIFGFDDYMKIFNNYIEDSTNKLISDGRIVLKLSEKFDIVKNNIDKYDSIIIATGFHERFLNLCGSVLKNVKSIYEVLENERLLESINKIVIYASGELSFKLALYLLKNKKKVSIVIQDFESMKKNIDVSRLSYYFYQFSEFKARVYIDAKVKNINEDFVEIIANNKLSKLTALSIVMNMISNKNYPYEPKLVQLDSEIFIYEPELVPNNKLYYDIVKRGFKGELFMIGNALKIGDIADDVKSAYFVAKNL